MRIPEVKNTVVNPNGSIDIFFNDEDLLPINIVPNESSVNVEAVVSREVGEQCGGQLRDGNKFLGEIATAINRACVENDSNTPDFILAEYVKDSLDIFAKTSRAREKWYGKSLHI